ncbi:MAG: peroxiredoxin [Clostridiaceae bacterium]|jgi:peroxiredoxin Q/BCP|nr:peroxiredoxin [Clostridiaceae bacterium]
MLPVNSPAPDFTLPDADGKLVSLSDFRGRKVVLYFYPKDNTPGCTSQACAFAERYDAFQDKGAVVIGISKDSAVSHRKFADRYNLPFILLSDPDREVIERYGVWQEKKMYGKPVMGVVRTTYVIDEQGLIISAEENVKAAGNPADVLLFLDLPD